MATTKITMLRNPASSLGCGLKEGETGDVAPALAETLVRMSIAVVVELPKVIHAIPNEPSIVANAVETEAEQVAEITEPQANRNHKKHR